MSRGDNLRGRWRQASFRARMTVRGDLPAAAANRGARLPRSLLAVVALVFALAAVGWYGYVWTGEAVGAAGGIAGVCSGGVLVLCGAGARRRLRCGRHALERELRVCEQRYQALLAAHAELQRVNVRLRV